MMRNGSEPKRGKPGDGHEETREQEGRDVAHVVHLPNERRARGATQRTEGLRRAEDCPLLVWDGADGNQAGGPPGEKAIPRPEHQGPPATPQREGRSSPEG